MKLYFRATAAALLCSVMSTPAQAQSGWSQAEKENAVYFISALQSAIEAHRISNSTRGAAPTVAELGQIQDRYEAALFPATRHQDGVLEKIHPELRVHFREEFQAGIELRLGELTEGDLEAERSAL